VVYLVSAYESGTNGQTPAAAPTAASSQKALVAQYCLTCHSDRVKAGGLALSELDLDAVPQHAEIAEKVIRKLRSGMMPPAGAKRPDSQSAASFVSRSGWAKHCHGWGVNRSAIHARSVGSVTP